MNAPSPLHFQRCGACRTLLGYPRVLCPGCGSRDLEWERSAGRGTVYSATVVHTREGRHGVLLVDLDEGVRVMGAGEAPIGAAVTATEQDGTLRFAA
ncbi:MAG TPA: zinc ribbon domain-containing protein [Solirubrobacteraceae bacterium]|nr:zinc ribbon domain-containing protein [Solirubrobacteraceae bacterium]